MLLKKETDNLLYKLFRSPGDALYAGYLTIKLESCETIEQQINFLKLEIESKQSLIDDYCLIYKETIRTKKVVNKLKKILKTIEIEK